MGNHQRGKVKGWVGTVNPCSSGQSWAGGLGPASRSLSTLRLHGHLATPAKSFHAYNSEKGEKMQKKKKKRGGWKQSKRKERIKP